MGGMRSHLRRWLALAALALAVLLAACSGSGEPPGADTPIATAITTPTAEPVGILSLDLRSDRRPPPTRLPTAQNIPSPENFPFEHPEGSLTWAGPDRRVSSQQLGHCGIGDPEFGVPALILVEDGGGFWGAQAVARQDDWRWTGYYHDGWQIWQGEDARKLYIVHVGDPRFGMEYVAFLCA